MDQLKIHKIKPTNLVEDTDLTDSEDEKPVKIKKSKPSNESDDSSDFDSSDNSTISERFISREDKIARTLKKFNNSAKGKTVKTKSHEKRSKTMEQQRTQTRANITHKKCGNCGDTKDVSEFNKKSDAKDGLQTNCKFCVNEIKKAKRNAQK